MSRLMRAAQVVAIGQPVEIREIPIPDLSDEDVLVRIARCGLNGGDTHLISGDFRVSAELMPSVRLPLTIGHRGCGVVAEVGRKAQGFRVGDRVIVRCYRNCGQCIYCQTDRALLCPGKDGRGWLTYKPNPQFARYKDGLASEYALAHCSDLEKFPDGVNFDAAVGQLEVAHLAAKRARIGHGDVVVITGATGITGVSAVLASKLFNPRKIIAVARDRRKLDHLRSVDPEIIETISVVEEDLSQRLRDLTEGEGADVLLDFISKGVETTRQAIYRMRPGGRVVLVGGCTEELCISYRFLMRSCLEITSSAGTNYRDFSTIMNFVRSGKLDLSPIAIYNFPLEQIHEAVKVLVERPGDKPFWVSLVPNETLA